MAFISKFKVPDELLKLTESLWNELFEKKYFASLILGGTISTFILLNFINNWFKQKRLFKNLNIPGPSPMPLIGNFHNVFIQGFVNHDINIMKKYGRTVGYFEGSSPVVLTTDVNFIKNVMIKDFNYFVNRRRFESLEVEPLDKLMTVLKDEEWKNVRAIITTAFTTGKLKSMYKYIHECAENLEKFLDKIGEKDGCLDTKEVFSCFSLDVISSCCFGISTNSLDDPDNEFIQHVQKFFENSVRFDSKLVLIFFFPKLAGYLSQKGLIEFFPMKTLRFFEEFINSVIHRRKNKLEIRDDFIQNILDHEENDLEKKTQEIKIENLDENVKNKWKTPLRKTLTNKEILSQSILFLLAGYETTSQTLSYIAYNLAMNPNDQEKLIQEVDDVLDRHDGKVNYESISEMHFMDNVINETLRMFPPAVRLDRIASADYEYNGMKIPKGMVWSVPIWALHHDPEIYPEPDSFRPERFDEKEKIHRENVAFLPFGAGPRNCVGMRFALLEIKILLTSVLSKYSFEKCDKTPEKVQIDNSGFARPTCPLIVKVNRR
uniref:Cytochrome p450 CYP3044A7 n=1 Tax=Brachionus calyciflorus TaxID=104777 RepID=A0A2H4PSG1_9BILA|nr:cytochrome p450 CYP3044A7 [Brachionus calyciflorus]